ncbi:hypothetical protein Skr01_24350 [Sphaerisporangium krabiense]|uniref:2-polyprenyl-6-methoxyphenol hydroxylase-like FAD-dependent oxidoreductase n=1 Tax=Sphaerisporangium krabiense TaxID=763782 RepID=A0A7W9DS90_9ACTN|nr:FAD-dependent monooxygenase [Sphaerisporangium krabiense]MBB5628180.1 2-polyprenyl-6-methoxyphenol hydroxylase-like FAD-dependent oxidoreductase [Sphaerisporangium krabiense]GII62350.1 hypothetical protein Skr01_24350 [Sphaerisporangium krabiense]
MTPRTPNRVAVVGAGAAGAFFALELSRLRPGIAIDLYDRDERSAGAGIVMSWEFAERVRAVHPRAFALPPEAMATWDRTLTLAGEDRVWSGAYGMFGLTRRVFHEHVRALACEPPTVTFHARDVTADPGGHDLLVVADGANSRLRAARDHGTVTTHGRTVFLWMSTPAVLEPTFVLKCVGAGVLIVHAYPHGAAESTFIVEADPDTLRSRGLLDRPLHEVETILAGVFRDELDGAPLTARTAGWRPFPTVVNERWHHGRAVLVGDAAHTVHFSVGSGTALAIDDAFCLARSLAACDSTDDALAEYARTRAPVAAEAQAEAGDSQRWFETLSRRDRLRGAQTVFALRSRRDANTFARLGARDPEFVARAMETYAGRPTRAEPVDVPLTVGDLRLRTRMVAAGLERDAPVLLFPTATGDRPCVVTRDAPAPPAPPCVLVTPDGTADPRELRAAGASAVGLLVSGDEPVADTPARGFDFVAVPAETGAGRIARTGLADRVRHESDLPVLLLSAQRLSRDEINTLLLAGRVDMVACVDARDLSRGADSGDGSRILEDAAVRSGPEE